ncbi:hypothetical protein CWC08_19205, partial [Pseudoalteromonas ruthenica]|uniref:hypothetical protein n=1 Tax=Pseudoalteromonas ruthenica TaxID=151081 RepID=UPI0012760705
AKLEAFWDYADSYMQLGCYIDNNYFYKHGLRFFFESVDRDLIVEEMSVLGRTLYHGIPAHQIDRAKFDNDLVRF